MSQTAIRKTEPAESAAALCPPARGARLRRLTLTDFRSYERVEIALDGRPVAIAGENGAGKTNLLEAISLIGPGRGLRKRRAAPAEAPCGGPGAGAGAGARKPSDAGRLRRELPASRTPSRGGMRLAVILTARPLMAKLPPAER